MWTSLFDGPGALIWSLLSRVRRWMEHTIAMCYRNVLLTQHLLPAIKQVSGGYFTFQQEIAPAHRARETIAVLPERHPTLYPCSCGRPKSRPQSSWLSNLEYTVLEERVYRFRIRNVDHLIEEWQLFDHMIIDRAIKQWRPRLQSCIREQGGHFEHHLELSFTSLWLLYVGNFPFSVLHCKR